MNLRGATVGLEFGILAEIASCQLEYTYLAKETGKREYFDLVFFPFRFVEQGMMLMSDVI